MDSRGIKRCALTLTNRDDGNGLGRWLGAQSIAPRGTSRKTGAKRAESSACELLAPGQSFT